MSTGIAAPERSLTTRAVVTGIVIGALLTPCNVYSGLKIGWSFNMSITAALLSLAFWRLAEDLWRAPAWQLQENVMNQTTASSAASIISGGLVAPIPALTLLTGRSLDWPSLVFWVFSVSALGLVVAAVMRRPMLVREKLVFPAGVATAETLREIHARGAEAAARVRVLAAGAVASGGLKLLVDTLAIARWSPGGAVGGVGFKSLGFSLDPSLLMIGFGAIIGLRAGLSLLLGAAIAWLGLAPWLLERGWAEAGAAGTAWFGPLVEWLLWPGVTLMTVASLVSFVRTIVRSRAAAAAAGRADDEPALPMPRRWFFAGAAAAFVLAVAAQKLLFDLPLLLAAMAVALAFVLAIVAARVVGETGIPPIGAIGKVSQLSFGIAAPANVTMNLMGANVTGGAAGQAADLLNDLRAGQLLGSSPARQVVAQCFGVLTGSLVGSLAYLVLIPDPATMLLSAQWPAPAVATWKAVAEVLAVGLQAIPEGSGPAMLIAALIGLLLALAPLHWKWLPSGAALGLAFVIPAWISISLAFGAVAAALAAKLAPRWSARFVLALAAGLVAGESLAGIGSAFLGLIGSR